MNYMLFIEGANRGLTWIALGKKATNEMARNFCYRQALIHGFSRAYAHAEIYGD